MAFNTSMLRDVPRFHLFEKDQPGELCQHIPDGRAESEVAPFQKTGAETPAPGANEV